jgi:hypothetical protein
MSKEIQTCVIINSDLGKERMKERLSSGKKGLHDPSVADVVG